MASTSTSQPSSHPGSEAEVRALVDTWVNAVRAKDAIVMMRNYAEDVVIFDVVPPVHSRGVAPYRERWQQWFDSLEGPVGFEMAEMHLTAGEDLAFWYSVGRISSTPKGGAPQQAWVRATVCFRKIAGRWLVVHEHASMPVSFNA